MKVLFRSFPKNGHTAWFDPQTKKWKSHCITKQTAPHVNKNYPLAFEIIVTPHDLIYRLKKWMEDIIIALMKQLMQLQY